MKMAALLLVLLAPPGDGGRVTPVRSPELVALLSTLRPVLEADRAAPHRLRAFVHRDEGECEEGRPCEKEVLYLSVAALDEYPERRAFRLRLPGPFRGIQVVASPGREDQDFVVAVRSLGADGAETCATWAISLRRMLRSAAPCPRGLDPGAECDALRALQVTTAAAAAKVHGRKQEVQATARGPFDWDGLVRAEPWWSGDPVRRLLGGRPFFRVMIQPAAQPDEVVLGGDYSGFVDAGSCELLHLGLGK
jgi:hypothetical protein